MACQMVMLRIHHSTNAHDGESGAEGGGGGGGGSPARSTAEGSADLETMVPTCCLEWGEACNSTSYRKVWVMVPSGTRIDADIGKAHVTVTDIEPSQCSLFPECPI